MPPVYLNGKFVAQRTTGVQRVAWALVRALDARLEAPWVLLCPPGVQPPVLRRIRVRQVGAGPMPLHLWEQLVLPWAARDGVLVNLAGSAPYLGRQQACMLHDAAVYDQPAAYTRSFVWWYRLLFAQLVRRGGLLLTVSQFSRARLACRLQVEPSRIGVVFNGSDHLDAVQADAMALGRLGMVGDPFVMTVASQNPAKNLRTLLAAWRLRPADGACRLVIVGGTNHAVFRQATDLPDPPGVLRVGTVGDAELKALYERAVALVVPSLYEGFGLTALEAMRCGCPVIASTAAAVPEVCGDAALYVDPRSAPEIAAAIQRLIDDQPLRARLRSAGLARAAAWPWAAAADRLLALLTAAERP